MGSAVSRTLDRAINKATYDPELDAQIAAEKDKGRDARTELQKTITEVTKEVNKFVTDGTITPQAATLMEVELKRVGDWVQANQTASASDTNDQKSIFVNAIVKIKSDDIAPFTFYLWLQFWTTMTSSLLNENKISSDKGSTIQKVLAVDEAWYAKNSSESIQTYQDRMTTNENSFASTISDPAIWTDIQAKKATLTKSKTTKDLSEMKIKVDQAAADRKAVEASTFSPLRAAKKTLSGMGIAFIVVAVITFGLIAGSTAANDAIARPVSIRTLYFIWSFIFSVPVLLYYIFRAIYAQKRPYYAAYLFPLYPYDPTKETHDSFFEACVWYQENDIIKKATTEWSAAAEALLSKPA
jgi:hypothetical protein